MIISYSALEESALAEYCRTQGVYPYHIAQWKLDFANGNDSNDKSVSRAEMKTLKHENKALKKELNRKSVYKKAKLANPIRWSGGIKNWDHIEEVYLNPEKGKSEVKESKAA